MSRKIKYNGKILVIGCGAISQCALPLLLKHVDMPAANITIIDFVDNRKEIPDILAAGVQYEIKRITKENHAVLLGEYIAAGDIILDLAWNIDTSSMLQWCYENDAHYINTSLEAWDPAKDALEKPIEDQTLYTRYMKVRKKIKQWDRRGPTAILEHGANPGLVSHFTKQALVDIAERIIEKNPKDMRSKRLFRLLNEKIFPRLAQEIGVKVIHISERDLQITSRPKEPGEFVNTWCVEALYEEAIAPVEISWGTHEKEKPHNAGEFTEGPKNQIYLPLMGMKMKVRSWVPSGEIIGMAFPHGEAFTISDHLTVWKDGMPVYRPTVHYAYCCSDPAINSLHEMEMMNYNLQEKRRIMTDEIIKGRDELGVLLMGHDFKAWWTGSSLDIERVRKLVPGQNATTLQVASSAITALQWLIKNRNRGVLVPDELPYQEILSLVKPYLGQFVSQPVNWTPLKNRKYFFDTHGNNGKNKRPTNGEVWQFQNFLVQ